MLGAFSYEGGGSIRNMSGLVKLRPRGVSQLGPFFPQQQT
jgi:hypothetical protein